MSAPSGRIRRCFIYGLAFIFFAGMAYFTLNGERLLYRRLPKGQRAYLQFELTADGSRTTRFLPASAVMASRVYALQQDVGMRGRIPGAGGTGGNREEKGTWRSSPAAARQPFLKAPWPGIVSGDALALWED